MSLIASPLPVHPKADARLAEGVCPATQAIPPLQEKTSQNLRESDQDARKVDQASRETSQNLRESSQDTRESGQALRETGQNLRESEQALRELDQDLRESNLALLESNEWFRLLVESVSDYAIYMLDTEGRIVTWNAGAERLKGYKREEVLGRNFSIFFQTEDVGAGIPAQDLAKAEREGRYETEAWRVRKDGSRFWALMTLTAIRGAKGELRGFAKVTRDRSEQRAADEALQSRNVQLERYRIIFENLADYVIFTLDTEGRIDSWSSGARNVLGYTAEEALGREYSLVFPPAEIQAGAPRREMEEAARRGSCPTDSWRVRRDGSTFWASGVLTVIRDETGKLTGYIRVARDMTAQKQMAEQLAQLAAGLENRVAERTRELEVAVAELQRKNKEVEAFVYIVSHDLRAPLVNVQGFVHELEGSCKHLKEVIRACPNWERCWPDVQPVLDKEMGGALHYIAASATKFERLIEALLGLSRHGRQVYQLARVNVWELVTNAVATFQQEMIEAGAVIEVGALPSVIADATALGQVFSNLIGNALKYRNPERPLKVELGGRVEDGMVHYFVRDNGLGIPEFGMAKLFHVFQRFHAKQAEGEGMGLAIVHRIVERHGGKIWAESRESEGTTFHFSLPAHPASTPNAD
jgi:PAS domain S-box-containing protein